VINSTIETRLKNVKVSVNKVKTIPNVVKIEIIAQIKKIFGTTFSITAD
jgi:predicted component of type VI protein secretion system